MLLPAPLPDELFASVLARLGRFNGIPDLREIAECCFGLEACPSFVDARLNLPEFCVRFSDAYGKPEGLLEQLTMLGARRCLGEIDEAAWSALALGEALVSVGELTFFGAVDLRFCPSCRKDDINRHGVAYWHRIHQLPILHRCVTHGERLKKAVIKRVTLHQSFPLPGDFSDEREANLPLLWNDCFEFELSTFLEALLAQARPCQALVGQTLLEGLLEWGFLTKQGSLRSRELLEFLRLRISQGNGIELPRVDLSIARQIVRSIREPARGVAFGSALLLCALFGNWRIVAERSTWLEVLGTSFKHHGCDTRRLEQDAPGAKEIHREKCLAYIADSLGYSRLGFTKQHYRSFRWLLHYDRAWLDHFLPVPEPDMLQICLF